MIISSSFSLSAMALPNPFADKKPTYTDNTPGSQTADCENCISAWMTDSSSAVWWIIQPASPIDDHETALNHTINLIQIAINRLLWILAAIALVYMLYNGFLIFSSGADDSGVKKGKKWIKTAAIALAWIGLSWLIVSAILWFINNIVPSA